MPSLSYNDLKSSDSVSTAPPVRVAARQRIKKGTVGSKRLRKQYVSPLFDDRSFPHPQDEWECMLPEVKNDRLIRKLKHEPHKLQDIDPAFGEE